MDIEQFVEKYDIRIRAEKIGSRPDGLLSGSGQSHWKCILSRKPPGAKRAKSMTVLFSQGSAWTTSPTAEDVLGCIRSDVMAVEHTPDFSAWLDEYGHEDDKVAKQTYKAVVSQRRRMLDFLNDPSLAHDAWDDFVLNVEDED
jgi:hypothetical protein